MIKFAAIATLLASVFNVSANINQFNDINNDNLYITPQSLVVKYDPEAMAEAQPTVDPAEETISNLTDFASTLLGRKYVWGAVGPKNFDCSGFTSYVFRQHGIELPRTSRMQYTQGDKVSRNDLKPGDLMFFSSPRTKKGTVGHVGIVVDVDETTNSVTFIHASTTKGITYQKFPDNGYYSRNYIGAKRVITPSEA